MAEGLTDDQLQELVDGYQKRQVNKSESRTKMQREGRIFVNRSLSMERVKYIGFDMDHTLVTYKSPAYEELAFYMAVDRLILVGYPQELKELHYDCTFPLRGLFFDKTYGNILKADQFGNILSCFHGFKSLSPTEIREFYPSKYVQPTDPRIDILYTLYNLPEVYLLCCLVDFVDNYPKYNQVTEGVDCSCGVKSGDVFISYHMVWQDVRNAIEWIHTYGGLKDRTLNSLDKYVVKDPQLPNFLDKLRQSGRKVFIATNSDYKYTKRLMTYVLGEEGSTKPCRDWKSYFDYIIVSANKPLFFEEGTMLREVDEHTGALRLGVFTGALQPGKVYNGGSSDAFCKYTKTSGKEILYVGDHIFGDVIKAKKKQAWRTFLIIPELSDEVGVWENCSPLFKRLQNLEFILAEMYTKMDNGSEDTPPSDLPKITSLRAAIKATAQLMEDSYPSQLGSLLRCGSRQTHFGIQASRFADLYSASFINLNNYPDNYLFTAPHQLMPHECSPVQVMEKSEVNPLSPELNAKLVAKLLSDKRISKGQLARGLSTVANDLDEADGGFPVKLM